jgi:hypothetical protein
VLLSSGDSFPHLIQKPRSQLGFVTYLLNRPRSLCLCACLYLTHTYMLIFTRRANVRHLSLLNFLLVFLCIFLCVFITGSCNDASIDKCRYSLVIYMHVCRRFPEIVKKNRKFHICEYVFSSVRDLCITRMDVRDNLYTSIR